MTRRRHGRVSTSERTTLVSSDITPEAADAVSLPAEAPSAADPTVATDGPASPQGEGALRHRRRRRRRRPPLAAPTDAAGSGLAAASEAADAVNDQPAPETAAVDTRPADAAGASGGDVAADTGGPGRPILRLRGRRRRRRRPAAPGLLPGPAQDADSPAAPAQAGDAAETAAPGIAAPGQRSFRAPRRRRRHAPLSAAAPAAAVADGDTPPADAPGAEPASRLPRSRNRRRRPTAPSGAATSDNTAGAPETRGPRSHRERRGNHEGGDTNRRDAPPRGARNPDRGRRREAPPGRGRRDGREGPRKVERKLYTIDAVVDRGFDDVEEEAGTRRVHWTIVKRTTADQVSRKAISAVYVLQRDGTDSEFPSLGAARSAVNKTIVHPEKLTRSKAEHAAERGGGKK